MVSNAKPNREVTMATVAGYDQTLSSMRRAIDEDREDIRKVKNAVSAVQTAQANSNGEVAQIRQNVDMQFQAATRRHDRFDRGEFGLR